MKKRDIIISILILMLSVINIGFCEEGIKTDGIEPINIINLGGLIKENTSEGTMLFSYGDKCTISWTPVENASYYIAECDGKEYEIKFCNMTFGDMPLTNSIIRIKAFDDKDKLIADTGVMTFNNKKFYKNSCEFNIEDVSLVRDDKGAHVKVKWNYVKDAESYAVILYADGKELTKSISEINFVDLSLNDIKDDASEIYVCVVAANSHNQYISSFHKLDYKSNGESLYKLEIKGLESERVFWNDFITFTISDNRKEALGANVQLTYVYELINVKNNAKIYNDTIDTTKYESGKMLYSCYCEDGEYAILAKVYSGSIKEPLKNKKLIFEDSKIFTVNSKCNKSDKPTIKGIFAIKEIYKYITPELNTNYSKRVTRLEIAELMSDFIGYKYNAIPDNYNKSYEDCNESSVMSALNLGILPFESSKPFNSEELITREEFAQILLNYIKVADDTCNVATITGYRDINNVKVPDLSKVDKSYEKAVKVVMKNNLMNIESGQSFNPKKYVTREEVFIALGKLKRIIIDND